MSAGNRRSKGGNQGNQIVLVLRLRHKLVFQERNKKANSYQTMRKRVSYIRGGKPYKETEE